MYRINKTVESNWFTMNVKQEHGCFYDCYIAKVTEDSRAVSILGSFV